MNEEHMQEWNWVVPDDDDIKEEEFVRELQNIASIYNHGHDHTSWHPSMIDGFKSIVEKLFFIHFSIQHKIEWQYVKNNGILVLKMSVKTKDLGTISTEISMDYLKTHPKQLPEQLIKLFEDRFAFKKDKLLKEWNAEKRKRK